MHRSRVYNDGFRSVPVMPRLGHSRSRRTRRPFGTIAACCAALLFCAPRAAVAATPILGTIEVDGSAWVSTGAEGWLQLSTTRPLLVGESVKTGAEGYLLLDLGADGIVGMYANTDLSTTRDQDAPQLEIGAGKAAFFIPADSPLRLRAGDAVMGPGSADEPGTSINGYVELNEHGDGVIVVEEGSLDVKRPKGTEFNGTIFVESEASVTVSSGERLLIGPIASTTHPAPSRAVFDKPDSHDPVAVTESGDVYDLTQARTTRAATAVGGIAGLAIVAFGSGSDSNPSP